MTSREISNGHSKSDDWQRRRRSVHTHNFSFFFSAFLTLSLSLSIYPSLSCFLLFSMHDELWHMLLFDSIVSTPSDEAQKTNIYYRFFIESLTLTQFGCVFHISKGLKATNRIGMGESAHSEREQNNKNRKKRNWYLFYLERYLVSGSPNRFVMLQYALNSSR